jgi:3-hydroxyisobutyrate dehydrogenase-like beta-hydroxyacid dehydrogenase
MNIGWIGAGKMGFPICQRLKAAGHHVVVLARTDAAEQKLYESELISAKSVSVVCEKSEVVFSSVSDDGALLQILDGLASLKGGSTYIDISTVSPNASKQVATRLGTAAISYLRSPVSGSTTMAQAGTLTAIVSGPGLAFDQSIPLFEVFAKKSFYVGETEEARYLKLVLNSMVAATSVLLGEALAFGKTGGLSDAMMLEVIAQSVVASPLINYKRDMIVNEDYQPAATLTMLAKDLDLFLTVGRDHHASLPVNSNIREIYAAALTKGLGEKDFFVLVREASQAVEPGLRR